MNVANNLYPGKSYQFTMQDIILIYGRMCAVSVAKYSNVNLTIITMVK